jgi:hypothetical protein
MGNYCAVISFSTIGNAWQGLIYRGKSPWDGSDIYKQGCEDLDKIIAHIDEMLCFYNNKDLELTNKKLPVGWHVKEDQ